MPSHSEVALETARHRATQLAIRALVMRRIETLWPLLDPDDITGSELRWMRATVDAVNTGRGMSARAAAAYYTRLREIAGVATEFAPPLSAAVNTEQAVASLHATGPMRLIRGQFRGDPKAAAKAMSSVMGSAGRLALAGGRDTILAAAAVDPNAAGWSRIASGNSCEFCQMLADRGSVYGDTTAEFEAHDNCACTAEPEFFT